MDEAFVNAEWDELVDRVEGVEALDDPDGESP